MADDFIEQIAMGRAQAALSREDFPGQDNLEPPDKAERDVRLKLGRNSATNLMAGVMGRNKILSEDIQALLSKVLQAAQGKPLAVSLSDELDAEKAAEMEIGRMILMQLQGLGQQGQEAGPSKPSTETK